MRTAAVSIAPGGRPIPLPSPAVIAAAVERRTLAVVEPTPTPAVMPARSPAGKCSECWRGSGHAPGCSLAPVEPAAVVRDRARLKACNAGRHEWVTVEALAVTVCLHCPTRADQAERCAAARRAR